MPPLLFFSFDLCILLPVCFVGTQPFPKPQHPVNFLRARTEDMRIDIRIRSFEQTMLIPLRLPDPQEITGFLQRRDISRFICESFTTSWMSMTGFAHSPGTEVDPTCSKRNILSPSAKRIRLASRSNNSGQRGSYSSRWMVALWVSTPPR